MQTKFKKIKRTVTDLVPVGYYVVTFEPIWGQRCIEGEHNSCEQHGCFDDLGDGRKYIADVDGLVTKVNSKNYKELEAIGMTLESNTKEQYGDIHDLRNRLFATKAEAVKHMEYTLHRLEYTLHRFKNPEPWESFVKQLK